MDLSFLFLQKSMEGTLRVHLSILDAITDTLLEHLQAPVTAGTWLPAPECIGSNYIFLKI